MRGRCSGAKVAAIGERFGVLLTVEEQRNPVGCYNGRSQAEASVLRLVAWVVPDGRRKAGGLALPSGEVVAPSGQFGGVLLQQSAAKSILGSGGGRGVRSIGGVQIW